MSTQEQNSMPDSQGSGLIRIQDAVAMVSPPSGQAVNTPDDAQMSDIEFDETDMTTAEDIGNKAVMELQVVMYNLNQQALDCAVKFNEAWVKKDKSSLDKYKKLTDEINDQIRTFNQTLHRVMLYQAYNMA